MDNQNQSNPFSPPTPPDTKDIKPLEEIKPEPAGPSNDAGGATEPEEQVSTDELIAPPSFDKPDAEEAPEKSEVPQAPQPPTPPEFPSAPPPPSAPQPPQPPSAPVPPINGTPPAPPRTVIKRPGFRGTKIIIIALIILAAAVAAFLLFFYRTTVTINPNPAPDKITIDGQDATAGTHKLTPINHKIVIAKAGFVTYNLDKKFSINEKLNIGFTFVPETAPVLINPGATKVQNSTGKVLLDFVSGDKHLANVSSSDQKNATSFLSNNTYPGIKQILFSKNDNFAFFLDSDALRVLDFAKADTLNQSEIKLPPATSSVSSIAWNSTESAYFPAANSEILYDFKTSYGWNLISANLTHTSSNILMQIDPKRFTSFQMDWSESSKDVIIAGGELGVLNIATRTYTKISGDNFRYAKWGPNGKYAAVLDKDGEVYKYQNGNLTDIKLKATPQMVSFVDDSNLLLTQGDLPVKVNFDTGATINYAEIKGLSGANSMAVAASKVYFTDLEGLKVAPLSQSGY